LGTIPTITVTTVDGSATGSTTGNASGSIGTIVLSTVAGSASGRVDRTPVLFSEGVVLGATGPKKRRRKRIEIIEIEDEIIVETPPPIVGSITRKKKRDARKVAALSPLVLEHVTTPVPAFASGDLPTYRVTSIEGSAAGGATAVAEVGSFAMLAHDRRAPWRTEWRTDSRNADRNAYVASLRNRRAA
jgi:hypothetical protein